MKFTNKPKRLCHEAKEKDAMKILFVVPYVPSLIRVRPYNLIKYLSKRGHRITLLTLWTSESEKKQLADLNNYCEHIYSFKLSKANSYWNCLKAIPSGLPLQSVYCWNKAMDDQLNSLIKNNMFENRFDVVHVEHLRGAKYGISIHKIAGNSTNIPVVWDSVDSISHLFRQAARQNTSRMKRLLTNFELDRTEKFEEYLVSRFEKVLVTSQIDKEAFLSLNGNVKFDNIEILKNGVDLEYFRFVEGLERDPETLVVSGKLSYHANESMVIYLVEEILPRVWEKRPEVKLWIVGKDPTPKIISYGSNPNITITGTVSDIRPYLRKATIAVAPITYGAGIQNKVLEAAACSTPVIATSKAASALDILPGEEILLADNTEDYAELIIKLLADKAQQAALGSAGRKYVEKNHSWDQIAEQLEYLYIETIKQHWQP